MGFDVGLQDFLGALGFGCRVLGLVGSSFCLFRGKAQPAVSGGLRSGPLVIWSARAEIHRIWTVEAAFIKK